MKVIVAASHIFTSKPYFPDTTENFKKYFVMSVLTVGKAYFYLMWQKYLI